MALTPSTMLPLGTPAPDFALPDPSGRVTTLSDLSEARALVVVFTCVHCPYVKHIKPCLASVARTLMDEGAAVVAVHANDAEAYPSDGPEAVAADAEAFGFAFPQLIDADQTVARAYDAACTPDFFVFDADRRLAYRGQFDGSRPGNDLPVSGEDLLAATRAVLAGDVPLPLQRPSIGCNIKWKPGYEPVGRGLL